MSVTKMTGWAALAAVAGLSTSFTAQAQTVTDELFVCLDLKDDAARLACFDTKVQALKAETATGNVQIFDQAEIAEIERESFGLPQLNIADIFRRSPSNDAASPRPKPERIEEIELAVSTMEISKLTGHAIITFENGQVWEQTDSARIGPSVVKNAKMALIKSASLGSFFIEVDGRTNFRAKRIK